MSLPGVEEARTRMLARVEPLASETVTLDAALGRVLRKEVVAGRDQPPFAASAMDGWAVRSADVEDARADLVIVGESAAGRGWTGTLAAGQALRISTGAPVPDGSDRVVMQEDAVRTADRVAIGPVRSDADRFVRPRAADFSAGEVLLAPGVRLDPWRITLAAAAGRTKLAVGALPSVLIAPTGNEIAAPGAAPGSWQIHDSASAGLAAWFAAKGCDVRRLNALPDDLSAVVSALNEAACDLLVTIGGASVGDHDVVKSALATLGLEMIIEGVSVRPGKPTWFGTLPGRRHVLGLPGNPVSAMVCAELFGGDIVAALEGAPPTRAKMRARLVSALPANGPREHYMRAVIARDEERGFTAEAASDQDSSLVSVLAAAGGLIRRPPHAAAAAVDDICEIVLLDRATLRR